MTGNNDRLILWSIVLIMLLAGFGWASNFIKLIRLDFKAPYKAEIVRVIGLSPAGIVIGYLRLEDY